VARPTRRECASLADQASAAKSSLLDLAGRESQKGKIYAPRPPASVRDRELRAKVLGANEKF
jgi:hypothetical protein